MPELVHQFEGEFYKWRCGNCNEIHETEMDPRGESVHCPDCEYESVVEGN